MKNQEIRRYAAGKGVTLWELSEKIGYSHESSLSRLLRHELPPDQQEHLKQQIDEIANHKE